VLVVREHLAHKRTPVVERHLEAVVQQRRHLRVLGLGGRLGVSGLCGGGGMMYGAGVRERVVRAR
jgi:hypothetical protein